MTKLICFETNDDEYNICLDIITNKIVKIPKQINIAQNTPEDKKQEIKLEYLDSWISIENNILYCTVDNNYDKQTACQIDLTNSKGEVLFKIPTKLYEKYKIYNYAKLVITINYDTSQENKNNQKTIKFYEPKINCKKPLVDPIITVNVHKDYDIRCCDLTKSWMILSYKKYTGAKNVDIFYDCYSFDLEAKTIKLIWQDNMIRNESFYKNMSLNQIVNNKVVINVFTINKISEYNIPLSFFESLINSQKIYLSDIYSGIWLFSQITNKFIYAKVNSKYICDKFGIWDITLNIESIIEIEKEEKLINLEISKLQNNIILINKNLTTGLKTVKIYDLMLMQYTWQFTFNAKYSVNIGSRLQIMSNF